MCFLSKLRVIYKKLFNNPIKKHLASIKKKAF